MHARELLRLIQQEVQLHTLDTFVDEPPAVAEGGRGVVVTGCPRCGKRFQTINQLLYHITDDVLPALFSRLSERRN